MRVGVPRGKCPYLYVPCPYIYVYASDSSACAFTFHKDERGLGSRLTFKQGVSQKRRAAGSWLVEEESSRGLQFPLRRGAEWCGEISHVLCNGGPSRYVCTILHTCACARSLLRLGSSQDLGFLFLLFRFNSRVAFVHLFGGRPKPSYDQSLPLKLDRLSVSHQQMLAHKQHTLVESWAA